MRDPTRSNRGTPRSHDTWRWRQESSFSSISMRPTNVRPRGDGFRVKPGERREEKRKSGGEFITSPRREQDPSRTHASFRSAHLHTGEEKTETRKQSSRQRRSTCWMPRITCHLRESFQPGTKLRATSGLPSGTGHAWISFAADTHCPIGSTGDYKDRLKLDSGLGQIANICTDLDVPATHRELIEPRRYARAVFSEPR